MESDQTYRDSYKYIESLIRQNCGGEINIQFNKLDLETQGELRKAIDKVLLQRKGAVGFVVQNLTSI